MGVDLHIRVETRRPGEKWCIAFEAIDFRRHSRRTEAMLIGRHGGRFHWPPGHSLGFDFGIPNDSPYYALSGDEYVPFSWAPWPLVLGRAGRFPTERAEAADLLDTGLLEWVQTVDAWRRENGFEPEQVRAICGHW